MATIQKQSVPTLFNDPALSDVKIKQVCNGKIREYFAHKAILSAQSLYFLKAFTGNFKEANEATMELRDDDPDHFEFALKFIYNLEYNAQEIQTEINKDGKLGEALFIMGLYTVSDKYDIKRLLQPAAKHLEQVLKSTSSKNIARSVIEKHYRTCSVTVSTIGQIIASTAISAFRQNKGTEDLVHLLKTFPIFAADIAVYHHEQLMINMTHRVCVCGKAHLYGSSTVKIESHIELTCRSCYRIMRISPDDW